jgi:hypothetical protein
METFCDRLQRDSGTMSTFEYWGVTSLLIDVLGLGFRILHVNAHMSPQILFFDERSWRWM